MKPTIQRKGIALLMALVAMALVTIVMTVLVAQIVAQRRLVQQRQRQLQAEWLARAGVELAAARLIETPTAFTDDKQELLPDTKLKITVAKSAGDVFTVAVEATVGLQDGPAVLREASTRFRRSGKEGAVRLEAVPSEKK
jgi:type II secretory pathway component PulK